MAIVIEIDNPDNEDETIEVELRTVFEVCPTCEGRGVSWPAGLVFTQSDFEEDPDLRENIASGMYDQSCRECRGLRVIEVVDEEDPHFEEYCKQQEAIAACDAEWRSEMRYCYGYDY
jgi:hypothetical protein